MLNKRTNILFDQEMWAMLSALAKEGNTSVGNLVRNAVEDKYKKRKKDVLAKRAYEEIIRIRPKLKGTVDYKALIEDGRRY